ncbi:hypothetical protein NEOLEDRAFT_1050237, partial [Neolentinus lepideus HHB14362 ss-1]
SLDVPSVEDIDSQTFRSFWSKGQPILVKNVLHNMQGIWSPKYFTDTYGSDAVSVVDCETNHSSRTTVRDFFQDFELGICDGNALKLKDWPPDTEFSTKFPQLYKAFIDALPVPDFTRPDGICNLTAHFPLNGVVPDLGPKMYNAYGTRQHSQSGTTHLHIDVTAAVNLMLHVRSAADGTSGSALWHIFPRSTAQSIRQLIRETLTDDKGGDPIHNQKTYLLPEMLSCLRAENVIPWTIKQHPGEAVFIPSGCPHQVCNLSNSIKVALDFLSLEDLRPTEHVAKELRKHRIEQDWGEDVLRLYDVLWYAWL